VKVVTPRGGPEKSWTGCGKRWSNPTTKKEDLKTTLMAQPL